MSQKNEQVAAEKLLDALDQLVEITSIDPEECIYYLLEGLTERVEADFLYSVLVSINGEVPSSNIDYVMLNAAISTKH